MKCSKCSLEFPGRKEMMSHAFVHRKEPKVIISQDIPIEAPKGSLLIQTQDVLPAQPLNRERLMWAIHAVLKTSDGKGAIASMIDNKEFLQDGLEISDADLYRRVWLKVKDADDRALIHRFFSNVDSASVSV